MDNNYDILVNTYILALDQSTGLGGLSLSFASQSDEYLGNASILLPTDMDSPHKIIWTVDWQNIAESAQMIR